MKKYIIILFIVVCKLSFAQQYTLSGYIKDSKSGEDLIGVNIVTADKKFGTTTNVYGFYSLSLPTGNYEIKISYIGYKEATKKIILDGDKRLNLELENDAILVQEAVVSSEQKSNIEDNKMSVFRLPIETIKTLPAFMGEVDVLKTIQLLPGIQASGEGNSGFYVRGGGPDQNLILLDEATVYNASHLFGFFSVFNADAIKNLEVSKGGMPAQYGGRISSVLDISMKNGNMKEYTAEGGIGSIASRLTVQGPIIEDVSSFIVSARRTYIDLLIKPFIGSDSPLKGSGYYFYDVNAKANYKFSDKDRIFLSAYYGKDVFNFGGGDGSGFGMSIPWGNAMASLRWNHLFSDKFFSNTSFAFTDYQFSTEVNMGGDEGESGISFSQNSGIRDYQLKQDYTYIPNPKHNIKFGWTYIYHSFLSNSVSIDLGDESSTGDDLEAQRQYAHEAAIYLGDDYKITDKLSVYAGVRASLFNQVGPFTRYVKDDLLLNNIDTIVYDRGESVAYYNSIEPRASIKYNIDNNSSFKASYMENKQYIHLASLSASTLPTDLWVPCSDVVAPQKGRQYAVGYFRNFFDDHFESSVEVYYKDMYNLLEYADGAMPGDDLGDNADNYFIYGDGYSYGIEFFLKKRTGAFTGWIGYTWSKTNKMFDEINNGEPFSAKYDRRHDLSITGTYLINEKWTAGAVFVFATGNATTLPLGRYMIDGQLTNEYGERNSYRMDPYHRLDISLTYVQKKTDKWESSWNFSIYNVYNRKNPYFIYFETSGSVADGSYATAAKQVSLFPILPSVTWNFKF